MNSNRGDYDVFIDEFNKYEEKFFEDCLQYNDLCWWHFVRYKIMAEILIAKKLDKPAHKIIKKNKIKNTFKDIYILSSDIKRIFFSKKNKVENFYFFTRRVEYLEELLNSEKKDHLVISRQDNNSNYQIFISYKTIFIIARFIKFFIVIRKNIKEKIFEISKEIETKYHTNVHKLVLEKYKTEIGFYYAWKIILINFPNLKKLFFTSNDNHYSLIYLTKKFKIESFEVQHGYMGATNIMYSLPKVKASLTTLPNKIIITNKTKDITYPVEQILIAKKKENNRETFLKKNIDVLIGSDLHFFKETIELSKIFLDKKLEVCIKLHPSQIDYQYYRKQIPSKIKIYSGDYEIKKLLKKSKIFIPIFPMSTTLFTAKEFKNIIIRYRFMNMRPSIIFDELIDFTADSTKELYSYIKKLIDK